MLIVLQLAGRVINVQKHISQQVLLQPQNCYPILLSILTLQKRHTLLTSFSHTQIKRGKTE